jgi:hypothetical protein
VSSTVPLLTTNFEPKVRDTQGPSKMNGQVKRSSPIELPPLSNPSRLGRRDVAPTAVIVGGAPAMISLLDRRCPVLLWG